MLLTTSNGTLTARLLFLRAVPLRLAERLARFGGGRFDLRADDIPHRLHPVGDDVPLLAIPLLDEHGAAALVILAARLHGVREALHAELVQRRIGEVQVFEAP